MTTERKRKSIFEDIARLAGLTETTNEDEVDRSLHSADFQQQRRPIEETFKPNSRNIDADLLKEAYYTTSPMSYFPRDPRNPFNGLAVAAGSSSLSSSSTMIEPSSLTTTSHEIFRSNCWPVGNVDLSTVETTGRDRLPSKNWAPRYHCPECGRSYSTPSGLSKHKQFHCTSRAKRQFGCKFCDKMYSSLGAMKMHIRTHTLPCKCRICGKAFSRPWLLQGHVRTHTGEKPFGYRCPDCGRAFADRSNLRAHLQTHSDVKRYKCKSCQKTFSRMSLLSKHEANGGCALLNPLM